MSETTRRNRLHIECQPSGIAPISIGDEVVMSPVDYELPDKGGSFRYLGVPINFKDLFPIEKLGGPEFPLDLLKLDDNDNND